MMTDAMAPAEGVKKISRRRSMAQWIAMMGVTAVDVRRFAALPVLMAALLLGLMLWNGKEAGREIVISFHGMCGVLSLMLGLALSCDDKERGTLWTLRALPVSPMKLLLQKMAAATILIVLFLLMCELAQMVAVINYYEPKGLLIPTLNGVLDPTIWNFGVWWLISLMQFICMIAVGLAAGAIFKNLFSAAILAFLIYTAWYAAWSYGFRWLELTNRQGLFRWVMMGQLAVLTAGAAWGFAQGVRWQSGIALLNWIPVAMSGGAERGLLGRWFPASPYLDRVIKGGAACLSLATIWQVVVSVILTDDKDELVIISALGMLVPGAIFGSLLFSAREIVATESALYWQPVSRRALLWQRARWILPYAVIATVFYMAIWGAGPREDALKPDDVLVAFTISVVACLYTLLFRLFVRNAMFSFVLGLLAACAAEGLTFVLMRTTNQFEALARAEWLSAITIAVPAVAVAVAYCRSHLMHQSFGRRSGLAISVFVTLLTVTLLLATTDVGELLIIINHKLQVMLEGGK